MTNPKSLPDQQNLINQSAKLLQQNRPGEAVAMLEPLYQQSPTNPDIAINLGGAYILQRKWDRAVRVLQKAAEANPANAMLWVNLAAAYLGNIQTAGPRQQDRAIRAYERALKIAPDAPNVHYHLGLIYKERGDLKRAITFFQRALDVRATDEDARYWLDKLMTLDAAAQQATATDTATRDQAADDGAVR